MWLRRITGSWSNWTSEGDAVKKTIWRKIRGDYSGVVFEMSDAAVERSF